MNMKNSLSQWGVRQSAHLRRNQGQAALQPQSGRMLDEKAPDYRQTEAAVQAHHKANSAHPVAPHVLDGDLTASVPNEKWTTDITYIPTQEG